MGCCHGKYADLEEQQRYVRYESAFSQMPTSPANVSLFQKWKFNMLATGDCLTRASAPDACIGVVVSLPGIFGKQRPLLFEWSPSCRDSLTDLLSGTSKFGECGARLVDLREWTALLPEGEALSVLSMIHTTREVERRLVLPDAPLRDAEVFAAVRNIAVQLPQDPALSSPAAVATQLLTALEMVDPLRLPDTVSLPALAKNTARVEAWFFDAAITRIC